MTVFIAFFISKPSVPTDFIPLLLSKTPQVMTFNVM